MMVSIKIHVLLHTEVFYSSQIRDMIIKTSKFRNFNEEVIVDPKESENESTSITPSYRDIYIEKKMILY